MRGPGEAAGATAAVGVPVAAEAREVEDRGLPDLRVELRLGAGRLRRLQHVEHALARRAGGAEAAALDQRLDRALVHAAGVHALAEVPQGREGERRRVVVP